MYQENTMKSFTEYLTESKRTYDFKVKIAGPMTTEQEETLEALLAKYQVSGFKKSGKTPVQALPLDFPRLTNSEVSIYEVSLNYPVASHELQNYLGSGLKISEQSIVVRKPGEPSEQYQEPQEKREGALLDDPTYAEAGSPKFEDFYGDKYNASLIKTLSDDLKAQRKAQGQVIPQGADGKTTNDLPQDNTSPIAKSTNDGVIKTRNGK
jgi:hypothetical protein